MLGLWWHGQGAQVVGELVVAVKLEPQGVMPKGIACPF
jgi:hypothetical protein